MDWGFSESGLGRGHSYYLLALRLLDYMGFAMEATTEWKLRGGGGGGGEGTHSSPTALGLGISDPHPTQISKFCLGLGGGHKSVLSPVTRLQEI